VVFKHTLDLSKLRCKTCMYNGVRHRHDMLRFITIRAKSHSQLPKGSQLMTMQVL